MHPYFLAASLRLWLHTRMVKACLAWAFLCLAPVVPLQAFSWETATARGHEYVTLQSFCTFYGFRYQSPSGNTTFDSQGAGHSLRLKLGSPDLFLDGVHYVMSFPVESGDRDWLVSRLDVIKLFEPVIRPKEVQGRHPIRGVVIDAGHGGSDNGAVSSRGGMEKNYTIDTAFRLEAILRGAGLRTVLTRRTDVFVDLYERAHIASLYPDYAFVSIHYNSASPEARGLETYCLSPQGAASTSSSYLTRSDIQKLPGNYYDATNVLLASCVHSEIIKLNPGDSSVDRGVKRARFVVIKQNVLPAILVEGGFVSNRMEAARVNTPSYRQDIAAAIARGVIRFVNVMGDKKMAVPDSVPEQDQISPKAPVAPPAPSGLAREVSTPSKSKGARNGNPPATAPPPLDATTPGVIPPVAGTGATSTVAAASRKSKKKKGMTKVTATDTAVKSAATTPVTSTPTPPSAVAPNPPDTIANTSAETNQAPASAPLNLAEPSPPTPTPGPEKASAEPDEPPTVNIYSTTPVKTDATEKEPPSTNATAQPSGPHSDAP